MILVKKIKISLLVGLCFLLCSCSMESKFSDGLSIGSLSLSAPSVTNSPTVSVEGICVSGSTSVELSGNFTGSPLSLTCDTNGEFKTDINITDPTITITAQQDSETDQTTIIYDTNPPTPLIQSPGGGQNISLTETISGSCESGLDVVLTGDILNSETTSCTSGNFSQEVDFQTGANGNRDITASQTDIAGNTGSDTKTYNLVNPPSGTYVSIDSPADGSMVLVGPQETLSGPCTSHNLVSDVSISGDFTTSPITATCVSDGTDYGLGSEYGGTYSADLVFNATPAGGIRSVTVSQTNSYDSSSDMETFAYITDNTSPSVTLTTTEPTPTANDPLFAEANFSEDVSGLSIGDFNISNGTITEITGGAQDYNIKIVPTSSGDIKISLPASSVTDASMNANTASNELVLEYQPKDTMITTWKINDPSIPLELQFPGGFSYQYTIDWGDGTNDPLSTASGSVYHTYASSGTYTVTIEGFLESWKTQISPVDRLLRVDKLGAMGWKDLSNAFSDCHDLTTFLGGDTSQVTDMSSMFARANNVTPDTSGWDTSNVTSMYRMFHGATLANPDTSGWDTSKVTNMAKMFRDTDQANPDCSGWDTSEVTQMYRMFSVAKSANPDTSGWDTSKVTDMNLMFYNAPVANPQTSGWVTSEVIDMSGMFYNASSAQPDTSTWNTSKVKDMHNMFAGATLAQPDTSGWDTSKVTSMRYMFTDATSAQPDTSGWDTSKVTTMFNMFGGATLANPVTSSWNLSSLPTSGDSLIVIFVNSGISNDNYSDFLIRVEATAPAAAVLRLDATAKYTPAAASARANLISRGWTINDQGPQ